MGSSIFETIPEEEETALEPSPVEEKVEGENTLKVDNENQEKEERTLTTDGDNQAMGKNEDGHTPTSDHGKNQEVEQNYEGEDALKNSENQEIEHTDNEIHEREDLDQGDKDTNPNVKSEEVESEHFTHSENFVPTPIERSLQPHN